MSLSFSSAEAFEGDKLCLTCILANRKLLPLPWLFVKFQVSRHLLFTADKEGNISDDYYKNDLLSVKSYQKLTRNMDFICGKRGFYKIKSTELICFNLLHTQKMVKKEENAAFLTVYPKLIPIPELSFNSNRIMGDAVSKRFINPDPFEFRGIREYMRGDDFKTLNFSATAKYGELMVNTYEFTVSNEIIIYLNFEAYSAWTDDTLFEKTISLGASLANLCINERLPVRVVSGSVNMLTKMPTDTGTGASAPHLFGIYDDLAKLDLNTPPEPIADYLPEPVFSANDDKAHILVSTYSSAALEAKYNDLKKLYGNIVWIMPHTDKMKITPPFNDVILWKA